MPDTNMLTEEPEPPSGLDALISSYQETATEFTFTLPKGEKITAKILKDAGQRIALQKKAQKIFKMLQQGSVPPQWQPFRKTSQEIVSCCVFVDALVIEPKIPMLKALYIAQNCGDLINEIALPLINRTDESVAEEELDLLEYEKNA
jgi:hypothetical protein